MGSLGGDSGEEGNSGEVVMLGREEVVTRPSSGCVPPRTSFFH